MPEAPNQAPQFNQTPEGKVILKDANGELKTVAPEEAHDAIASVGAGGAGWSVPTPDEIQRAQTQAHFKSLPEKALGAAEAFARVPTFGLSTALETGIGKLTGSKELSGESILAREKYNPLSEAVGTVGGFLTPFGATKLILKAGEGGAKALGLTGETLLGKIGAGATRGAIESSLIQGENETSKMLAGDPDQGVGSAAANIGMAGLIGAGGGAVLGSVSPLWKAANESKAVQFLSDFKSGIADAVHNPEPAEALRGELESHYNNITSAADEVYGPKGLKAQDIAKAVPEAAPAMAEQTGQLSGKFNDTIELMKSKPSRYPDYLVSKAEDKFNDFNAEIGQAKTPAETYQVIDKFKRQLQDLSDYRTKYREIDPQYEFVNKMKNLANDYKNALEDTDVWGKAAERQTAINKGFREFLPALKDFESKFTSKIHGGEDRVIDPAKVNTYVNQLGKPNAELKQEMLQNFMNAAEQYKKTIETTHANLGMESPFTPASNQRIYSSLEQMTPGKKLANALVNGAVTKTISKALGAITGGVLGHEAGEGFLGAILGEHILDPFFRSVLPPLVKPILSYEASGSGLKAAADYGAAVSKGESMISKAVKSILRGTPSGIAEEMDSKRTQKLDERLKALQGDPSPLFQTAGDVGHYLPDHAVKIGQTAANGVNFLNQSRPTPTKQGPLDSEPKVSDPEKAAYDRKLQISQNPLIVLKSIKEGTLTPQDVQTVKTLYPGLYNRLNQKLMDEVVDATSRGEVVPYSTRLNLSLFMGMGLDSTMKPQSIHMSQSAFMVMPANKPPPMKPNALAKLPEISMTHSQLTESRALK